MYQIRPNKRTEFPGQHICCQVAVNIRDNVNERGDRELSFRAVLARRFRLERGKVCRVQDVYHEDLSSWWKWLYAQCNPKIGTWVWCDGLVTHLALLGALRQLSERRLIYRRSVLSPKIGYIKCETQHGRMTWLDRSNWWRCPIDQLLDNAVINDLSEWRHGYYKLAKVEREAKIVLSLAKCISKLLQFVAEHDLGVLRLTAAGQSLQAYRHRFGLRRSWERVLTSGRRAGQTVTETRLWPRRHDNAEALRLERASYYGGPTHCFYIGKVDTPIYVLDVRSLYPYIMRNTLFPCELLEIENAPNIQSVLERSGCEGGIAAVELGNGTQCYPCRNERNTIYAIGSFGTILCGAELSRALEAGTVQRIRQIAWYRLRDLFSPFVDYFFERRNEYERDNQLVWADLCKLILNSLASKFGQFTGEWVEDQKESARKPWGYWHVVPPDDGPVKLCRSIAENTQTLSERKESAHSFPAIPAFMCAAARVYMDSLFTIARSAGKVYYSAIDSIHCDLAAYNALTLAGKVGDELGQLRLKTMGRSAIYQGVGDYAIDGVITRSGLPIGAKAVCRFCRSNIDETKQECNSCGRQWDNHTYAYRATETINEMIDHGPRQSVLNRDLYLSLPSHYEFGKIGPDGWVTPFTLPDNCNAKS